MAQQCSHTFDKRDEKRNADRDERRCGGRVETEQSEKQQTEHCSPFMIRRLPHYTCLLAGSPFLLNLLWKTLQHIHTSLLSPTPSYTHLFPLSLPPHTSSLSLAPPLHTRMHIHSHTHSLTHQLTHTYTISHTYKRTTHEYSCDQLVRLDGCSPTVLPTLTFACLEREAHLHACHPTFR